MDIIEKHCVKTVVMICLLFAACLSASANMLFKFTADSISSRHWNEGGKEYECSIFKPVSGVTNHLWVAAYSASKSTDQIVVIELYSPTASGMFVLLAREHFNDRRMISIEGTIREEDSSQASIRMRLGKSAGDKGMVLTYTLDLIGYNLVCNKSLRLHEESNEKTVIRGPESVEKMMELLQRSGTNSEPSKIVGSQKSSEGQENSLSPK